MPLEERLRFRQQERGGHAGDGTAAARSEPDVLSRETVTNDLQASTPDDAPQQPEAEQPGEREADHGDDVDAELVRAALGEDPDQARAAQRAGDEHRDHEA